MQRGGGGGGGGLPATVNYSAQGARGLSYVASGTVKAGADEHRLSHKSGQ